MIGCCLAEVRRWWGEMCGQGQEDLGSVLSSGSQTFLMAGQT